MAITLRAVLLTAVPTIAALLGLLWFKRKKKPPSIESPSETSEPTKQGTEREGSPPKVILTQPSDEGKKVTELVSAKVNLDNLAEENTDEQTDVSESIIVPVTESVNLNARASLEESRTEDQNPEGNITSVEIKALTSKVDKPITILKRKQEPLLATDRVEEVLTQTQTRKLECEATVSQNEAVNFEPIPSESDSSLDKNTQKTVLLDTNVKDSVTADSKTSSQVGKNKNVKTVLQDIGNKQTDSEQTNKSDCVKQTSDNTTPSVELEHEEESKELEHKEESKDRQRTESEGSRKRKWTYDSSWDTEEESVTPTAASPVDHGSASTNGSETSIDSGIDAAARPKAVVYEFNFPTELCGLLIGSRGKNIRKVMDQTAVQIVVKKKIYDPSHQLVQVEGSQTAVDKTMEIFRRKFPPKKFQTVDLSPAPPEHAILIPEIMQLNLPDGVAVDAIVSSVVTPNHIFIQQPTHPTFPMLEKQNTVMNLCYSQDGIVPQLPRPVEVGVICAAPMYNGWYRSQVVQTYSDTDEVDLRFVDYGGYMREPASALRQIRSDFTTLPFQSVECYLANVIPPKDMTVFPAEANAVLEQLVQGQVGQAEVVGHEDDGVPYINLYVIRGQKLSLVNRELVEQGVARWMEAY